MSMISIIKSTMMYLVQPGPACMYTTCSRNISSFFPWKPTLYLRDLTIFCDRNEPKQRLSTWQITGVKLCKATCRVITTETMQTVLLLSLPTGILLASSRHSVSWGAVWKTACERIKIRTHYLINCLQRPIAWLPACGYMYMLPTLLWNIVHTLFQTLSLKSLHLKTLKHTLQYKWA